MDDDTDATLLGLGHLPSEMEIWMAEPDLCPVHKGEKPCLYHPCDPGGSPIPAVPRFQR